MLAKYVHRLRGPVNIGVFNHQYMYNKINHHNCAAANAGIMAGFVGINSSIF